MRNRRRTPPPRWRTVMRPWLLRPAVLLRDTVRCATGFSFERCVRTCDTRKRMPGLRGL